MEVEDIYILFRAIPTEHSLYRHCLCMVEAKAWSSEIQFLNQMAQPIMVSQLIFTAMILTLY